MSNVIQFPKKSPGTHRPRKYASNQPGEVIPRVQLQKYLKDNPVYNACSDPCDNTNGPCACGAWHDPYEILSKIQRTYGILLNASIRMSDYDNSTSYV